MDRNDVAQLYRRQGFLSPIQLLPPEVAAAHREIMESVEAVSGPLHYRAKPHASIRSAFRLATLPQLLDVVEMLIGPDILLREVTYVVKEPNSPTHVSWHQDLAYRDISPEEQVGAWIALSPATEASGCMRMIPGSHSNGRMHHDPRPAEGNLLSRGQTVPGVDETRARLCALEPGQASLHHGWTLHASGPNTSKDRRIGLRATFYPTHVRENREGASAMLVRGKDQHGHFATDKILW